MRILLTVVVGSLSALAQVTPQSDDWPVYGRDPGGTRFSPIDQINTSNVSRLRRAGLITPESEGGRLKARQSLSTT